TETTKLSGLITGYINNPNWHGKDIRVDFYDAKGDLEVLLGELLNNLNNKVVFETIDQENLVPGIHPGQSANIKLNNKSIGWIGSAHPQVIKKTKIDNSVILFELNLDEIKNQGYTEYREIS